jgi:mono/diheme cytochrome c family protein
MKVFLSMLSVAVLLAANPGLGQEGGDLLKQGQGVYENNCADCHRGSGEGLPVKFPALKGNALVMGDPKPVLDTVLNGRKGKLGQMPAWHEFLNDGEVAAVVSYIRNAWGNQAPAVSPETVAKMRGK